MKRLLTAGIFGTILGIVGAGTANASIVSSGFLDEKLTEYALSTSLDLKANQRDLTALSNKIGTLPSGNFPEFPGYEHISYIGQPLTYPTSLAELITALYGNSETDAQGLLSGIITGFPLNGNPDEYVGLMPNFDLARTAIDIARANATKIGTVPDGKNLAGMISETDAKIGVLPPDTTVTGMMGNPVLLNREQTIIPLYDLILLGSNGQLVVNPINGITMPLPLPGLFDIADAVKKIGDLPKEYATVGAALTAIKGIAEDAKAAALAAIPDPKQEGSSGKFVLTVDIVGDNATYRWEKIDREGETTTE